MFTRRDHGGDGRVPGERAADRLQVDGFDLLHRLTRGTVLPALRGPDARQRHARQPDRDADRGGRCSSSPRSIPRRSAPSRRVQKHDHQHGLSPGAGARERLLRLGRGRHAVLQEAAADAGPRSGSSGAGRSRASRRGSAPPARSRKVDRQGLRPDPEAELLGAASRRSDAGRHAGADRSPAACAGLRRAARSWSSSTRPWRVPRRREAYAEAMLADLAETVVTGSGTCGRPAGDAGRNHPRAVRDRALRRKLRGRAVTHTVGEGGYQTSFEVTDGQHDRPRPTAPRVAGRRRGCSGVVVGIVHGE